MPAQQSLIEVSMLAELRQSTRSLHSILDTQVDILNNLNSPLEYRAILERFFGIYTVLEPQLVRMPGLELWLSDIKERQRLPALISDLHFLGSNLESLPLCYDMPRLQNAADAFGCLYVLEGSTLGGQVISRHVKSTLGFTAERGCRFFSAADRQVPQKWAQFIEVLEDFANADPEQCSAVVENAKRTFQTFIAWFSSGDRVSLSAACVPG